MMKKLIALFSSLIWMVTLTAQNKLASEDDLKGYILWRIENYDPIMGIYIVKNYQINSILGQTSTYDIGSPEGQNVAIIRRNSCFLRVGIPTSVDHINADPCDVFSTTNPDIYLFNGQKIRIDSEGNFEWVRQLSNQEIMENKPLTMADILKFNYKVYARQEWIKIFPTKSDIAQAIKESGSKTDNSPSSGTGFAISSSGLIATNYHVIEGAKSIMVKGVNQDFNVSYKASVVVTDPKNDLAIIKIDDSRFKEFNTLPFLLRKNTADVGESIFVLGFPLTATMGEEVKLTNGIISSRTGYEGDISMYQISAPVQPGNSGGPLFDNQGNIIGIVSAKHLQTENVAYAIKINYLLNLTDLVSPEPSLPISNTISQKTFPEKVKILSNYVFIILLNEN
jgi:hypothetical protein